MIVGLDHVVLVLRDIEAGVATYQSLFARAPAWRAEADGVATVLFTLDNTTLELIAPKAETDSANRIRAALDAQGEGLASICFRTNDIERMHRRLERLALKPTPVGEAESRDITSGAVLQWKRTRTETELTRGVRLFFLQREAERPASPVSASAPITAMDHIVISTGDPERAAALYGARLGLDMALDRSHPDWGRLMFFRCGDLIVEVAHHPESRMDAARDRLRGVCWRIEDADATRARLVSAGIDVSEIRAGRKPGTRVMTVRSGTCGVPTLLVERTPRPA
ncbi:MAG: VOC family protein [Proteobacteria bacterium]|nr:VOC family protein [Pseudomonadota bacterium]